MTIVINRPVAILYNPDLLTKEQLIASFVVRKKKFDKLFADIKSAKMEHPEQHILIVGLRGMGKTTLLRRIAYEVENDPKLNPWLLPIIFNEEEYGITRLYKFWEAIAEYMEKKDIQYRGLRDDMEKAYDASENDQQYEASAFEIILKSLRKNKNKLLLFIDNFGDLFKKFNKNENQRLREVLTTIPDLRVIAGSAVAAESFFKYNDPLYELFKIEKLDGLSKEETETLLLELGKQYPVNPVEKILKEEPERIEAMRRITGGIPRSMVLLFEIFVDDKEGTAFTDLESVLDRVTTLYKHRMDDLSSQQQEILHAMALQWDGISSKEIAQKTRLDSKLISAQLKQLQQNNIVDIIQTGTKNHLYLIHDRFFNIWYLMRMARKGDKNKVLWLIKFLEEWCGNKGEFTRRTQKLFSSMNNETYNPKAAFYMSHALYYSDKQDFDTRYQLSIQASSFMDNKDKSLKEQVDQSDMAYFGNAYKFLKNQDWPGALDEMKKLRDKTGQDWLLMYVLHEVTNNTEQAEICLQKVKSIQDDIPERIIGNIYCNYIKDFSKSIYWYEKAVAKNNIRAIRNIGWVYQNKLKDYSQAKNWYRKAIHKGETYAWINLGNLYYDQLKKYEEAEEYYVKGTELGHYVGLVCLGMMYHNDIKDYEKAEVWYRKAIEKGETYAWINLGNLYRNQLNKYDEAGEYYLKGAEFGHFVGLRCLGMMYHDDIKDYEKAEVWYRKAIEKGETYAWINLGNLYSNQLNKYNEAGEYYLKGAEFGHFVGLHFLGMMYHDDINDYEKAEVWYRKAIEKGETYAWIDLGDLYYNQLKNFESAEEYYLKGAELGHAVGYRNLGIMYHNDNKDYEKAEAWYRKAIEEGETYAWINLGNLYYNQLKDFKSAEEYYLKGTELGHVVGYPMLGIMYHDDIKDYEKAEAWYRKAIEKGETYTWINLGNLYCDELKDFKSAEEYYLKGTELGHVVGYRMLGILYHDDIKDYEKAEAWYRKAIEKGETYTWINLGNLYKNQLKDYKSAEKYYLKGTELGHVVGYRMLGIMYHNDLKDYEKAEYWYRKAIEKGETYAWINLGSLYCNQLKNFESAEEYYSKAIEGGHNHTYNSWAWGSFKQKRKPEKALAYAYKAYDSNKNDHVSHTLSCILLWNNKIVESLTYFEKFWENEELLSADEEWIQYPLLLLAKGQYQYLYDYFNGEIGQKQKLKDRLKPLWYSLLYFLRDKYPTEYLRMPPELKQTVEEIIEKVEQMKVDYA